MFDTERPEIRRRCPEACQLLYLGSERGEMSQRLGTVIRSIRRGDVLGLFGSLAPQPCTIRESTYMVSMRRFRSEIWRYCAARRSLDGDGVDQGVAIAWQNAGR